MLGVKLKKISMIKVLLITSLLFSLLAVFPTGIANAAYSNGFVYNKNGCKVQVYTDYYRYYPSSSTTVDAFATNSGCGTLYYTMKLVDQWGHSATSESFEGYFSKQTPTKYFSISKIRDYTAGGQDSDAYMVEIYFYTNAAKTNYLGMANSNIVVVK